MKRTMVTRAVERDIVARQRLTVQAQGRRAARDNRWERTKATFRLIAWAAKKGLAGE